MTDCALDVFQFSVSWVLGGEFGPPPHVHVDGALTEVTWGAGAVVVVVVGALVVEG